MRDLDVLDEDDCMVSVAKFYLEFTVEESCGKCTPCREGTKRMLEILTDITEGRGKEGDIERLQDLATHIKAGALCALGQTAPNPVLSTIRFFSTGCILYGASSFMGSMTKERLCMSTWGMHRSSSDITRSS